MFQKKSSAERLFDIFNYTIMGLFCLTIMFPFWQQIVISISSPVESRSIGLHLYSLEPTFDAYRRILRGGEIPKAYYWTILRTVLGTFLTVTVTAMMAYPLSKKYFWGQKFWMKIVVFTMFFGGGIVPTYLLIRSLRITNTIWSLVLPGLCSAWNIIILRNFFNSLPEELEESAKIDGAEEIYIFFKIVLPLSAPVIATITLWTMVGHWNAWFDAMIYITNNKIKVLQILLRQVLNDAGQMSGNSDLANLIDLDKLQHENYTPESVKAAILMVVITPILCVYPFLQKYFVKGIMVGAVKG